MPKAMLIDITKCIGCESCMDACREVNHLPESDEHKLSANTWEVVNNVEDDIYARHQCMHCIDPTCVSVCPVGALEKHELGPVTWRADKCIGCRYCMMSCPFNIPKYEWHSVNPRIRKCIFCYDRLKKGEQPACAQACPTGATKFGERDELLKEAWARIKAEPNKYVHHVYGEHEVGGTSFLYISHIPFEKIGLPGHVPNDKLPEYTWRVLSELPSVVFLAGTFLGGMYWLTNRKNEIAKIEHLEKEEEKTAASLKEDHKDEN